MKVVLLAGGFGTRLSEYTDIIPKPLVPVAGMPILWHIMKLYSSFGYNEFYIALGYKGEEIKKFFRDYQFFQNDIKISTKSGDVTMVTNKNEDWEINLIETGSESMTGGRLKRMTPYLDDDFMLTYGDGIADINIHELVKFHKKTNKIGTVTCVRPIPRFGNVEIKDDIAVSFEEKNKMKTGWVNGGFFIFKKEFLDLIDGDYTILEKEPLENLSSKGQLAAFKHEGFWQCMDTKRDKDFMDEYLSDERNTPWI